MTYTPVDGRSLASLEAELRAIYLAYPEYSDPAYGGGDFERMVRKFASDDFYRSHHIAKAYLVMKGEA